MERTIYGFIFRYSKREQVFILFFTLLALPFYYVSLDIPKLIVNNVLSDPEPIAELSVPGLDASPAIVADERMMVLMGFNVVEIERLNLLAIYAGLFLLLVLINGGFKYFINVYKGLMGERMLRRLRYSLYSRIMRFPLPHFRRVSAGELIPMVTQEVEPLGGFIGDALALPMFQGGLLITALIFIFMQDVWMGLAAISLYPMQGWIIPKLQRKVNLLGKARVREVRKISERIAETVQGAEEMHANGMARWEMAEFTSRMGRVFEIRFEIYRKKFFIKFLNNFLAQLTPFFFYAIGGYFVIDGALSLGGLVAVLAAYKDLPPPWKELLNHYQIREDSKIKYDQVVAQFAPIGMREADIVVGEVVPEPFNGALRTSNLRYDEDGEVLIDSFNVEIEPGQHIALVGGPTSSKDRAVMLLAHLLDPNSGKLRYGDAEAQAMPEVVTGTQIGFVGPSTSLFSASLMDNVIYGLRQAPKGPREHSDDT
ncbi:MAG: ABC transporter ATP-binding protein, partial [Rhodospirillaceae bacterium]|nr:ABC transporter ATP-binding protein [Rhodospirillaceae bacterium]